MRFVLLSVVMLWLTILVGCGADRAVTMVYPIPNPRGVILNPASDFVKEWPGRAAVFKLSDQLILKIPPMYQKFWLQGNKVKRTPIEFEDIPAAELIGFQFFMPDFGGYDSENYNMEFSENVVDVIDVKWVGSKALEIGAAGSFPPNMYERAVAVKAIHPLRYNAENGLRCFDRAPDDLGMQICYGPRNSDGGYILLRVIVMPHYSYISYPIMQATYTSKEFGGTEVTWRAHMKHFSRWSEIDAQVWKFIRQWEVSMSNRKSNRVEN